MPGKAHLLTPFSRLDLSLGLASRRLETIDRSVVWIIAQLGLKPGDAVLDLGCGPNGGAFLRGYGVDRGGGAGCELRGDHPGQSISSSLSYGCRSA